MIDIVTLKDIFKAVCDHISETTSIPLVDSDLEEPVERPAFKIFMDTVNTGLYSSGLRQVKVYFNCYYYAKNEKHSKSEIYEIEDKLAFSFLEPFQIKEHCLVYIGDIQFEMVDDGILNCSFNFEIATEFVDESNIETMDYLHINLEEE